MDPRLRKQEGESPDETGKPQKGGRRPGSEGRHQDGIATTTL